MKSLLELGALFSIHRPEIETSCAQTLSRLHADDLVLSESLRKFYMLAEDWMSR